MLSGTELNRGNEMKVFMKVLNVVGWVSALAAVLMGEPAGVLAMIATDDDKPSKGKK